MNAPLFNDPMVSGVDLMSADMATQRQPAPLPLAPVGAKAVELDFDGGCLSCEAGIILLKAIDDPLGLTRALAAVLSDRRDARRLHFTPEDLLKPRVLHIAAGYEDANDATTLRDAPILKLRRDRLPESGAPLASQATIARFENHSSRPALSRMALVLLEQYSASYAKPPQVIVLEVDDTEDRVHGPQEHARDDGDEGGYGCLPLPL